VRRYEGRFRERKMKISSFAESNNNQTELPAGGATAPGCEERAQRFRDTFDSDERKGLVRAQNAALIASGFRYSPSLNKAHSKHRALLANRLHFGVVDKSDDYLPSAKAYLRHPQPLQAKCLSASCAVSRGALLAFRTSGHQTTGFPAWIWSHNVQTYSS
jgi:hypothetical protein